METEITINGIMLSPGEVTAIRVALETFHADLKATGLGDDFLGIEITKAYLAAIENLRRKIYVKSKG